jgi:quercetin dioxygenase-like cupin family protein
MPDRTEWKPAPPTIAKGTQIAVLYGNPQREGPFTMRVKVPPGTKVPPHRHPKDELFTVISGTIAMGFGEKSDGGPAQTLVPGSFVVLPQGHAHYFTTDQETVFQINGVGPFGIEFVNPDDDPRRKAAAQ